MNGRGSTTSQAASVCWKDRSSRHAYSNDAHDSYSVASASEFAGSSNNFVPVEVMWLWGIVTRISQGHRYTRGNPGVNVY